MEPIEACQMIQRIEGAMVRIMHSNKFIIPRKSKTPGTRRPSQYDN